MKLISHRGNMDGQMPSKENRPSYIDSTMQLGIDVEVDLRFIDGDFYLGHDNPDYKVTIKWMELRKDQLWFHCKNIEAVLELLKQKDFKYFCHTSDNYVLTSTNHIWVHDLDGTIDENCIIPLLDKSDIVRYDGAKPYAVCTDYINVYKKLNGA